MKQYKDYDLPLALRFLRAKRGKTQSNIAEDANVDRSYISHIESDTKVPAIETLDSILKALDISFSDFFRLAEDMKKNVKKLPKADKKLVCQLFDLNEKERVLAYKLDELIKSG